MHFFYNNKNTIRVFFFLIFLLGKSGMGLFAQTTLTGKVTDAESGEELIGANIVVTKNGNFIQGETTDIDGNFKIRVDPETYDVEVSYTGYPTHVVEGIPAKEGVKTEVNIQMTVGQGQLADWIYSGGCICKPLISQDETTTGDVLDETKIKNLPTRNIKEILLTTPGVSFSQ